MAAVAPSVPHTVEIPELSVHKSLTRHATAIVVGLASSTDTLRLVGGDEVDELVRGRGGRGLLELAAAIGASGKRGSVTLLPTLPLVALAGVGDGENSPEPLRQAVGAAVRAIIAASSGAQHVAVCAGASDAEQVKACVEGALLGGYTYAKVGAAPLPGRLRAVEVVATSTSGEFKQAVELGRVVATNVLLAREWVNTPANLLYPETFAAAAVESLKSTRVGVEVLDDAQLREKGYGGISAVGGGSARGPRLLRASFAPRGAKFHLALVGKGITFDSGGLDIKNPEGMYTMKSDMAGAAAVIAATRAIAQLGLQVRVTAWAPMAENLPSGSAYRPSDVLTMYGGQTVENANTDAEGRLVMADALARASEDKPDLVLDVATLTGACVVALGERVAGLMASDDETAALVLDAAELAGEDFWQLPIPHHLRTSLDSKVADMKSSGVRSGGALTAAAFLQRFVGDLPWAHLDIAGPAFNAQEPYDYVPAGGTGHAVRTLVALAASLAG